MLLLTLTKPLLHNNKAMKKLIFMLFAFVALAISTPIQAQVIDMGDQDTITNIDTAEFTKSISKDYFKLYSIQPIISRTSGTLDGRIVITGSNNDTNYVYVDSVAIVNGATFSNLFNVTTTQYKHYKVTVYQEGTAVSRCRVLMYFKKD